MNIEKTIKKYEKNYKKSLKEINCKDIDEKVKSYVSLLKEMYLSDNFKKHNIYPTTNTVHVYGVMAMCLELKSFGYSNEEIIAIINKGFEKRRNFFKRIINIINILPNSFDIVKKWNINDHEKREKDKSVICDYFNESDDKIEYKISKCMYVEMFDTYGIKELCKIFCMTDEFSYAGLTRHVKFIRHSDLSDGPCCHDEVIRK